MKSNQTAQLFERRQPQLLRARYLLFLPSAYEEQGSVEWPLLFFLHGAGERGANLSQLTAHGPPRVVGHRPDFPFVVVSPQCPRGQWWSNEVLRALLDEVIDKYRIDPRRIYLTGLSMGGYGTWSLALTYPARFAAAVPICGGGELLPILLASPRNQAALRALPVWAFHGAKDPIVPVEETERMVAALQRLGGQPKLTILREAGHDCWTDVYNDPALYKWLLAQTRRQRPPSRVLRAGHRRS